MAKVVALRRRSAARIGCSSCGATVEAACDCGAPYVPADQRVAEFDVANPGMSTRQVAAALGISNSTVHEARQKPGVRCRTPKPRKKQPKKIVLPSDPTQEACTDCSTPEEHWHRSLSNLAGDAISMREFWTREFGEWKEFEISSSLVTLAKQAAKVWSELAADLTKRGG